MMTDFESLLRRCAEYHRFVNECVGDVLVPWAADRFRLGLEFSERLTAYPVDYSRLPREWEESVFCQYVAAKLFCGRRLVREFIKSPRRIERIGEEDGDRLRKFSREGWRFIVCAVAEAFGGDFFNVLNYPTGEKLLLHSPGLSQLLRESADTFLLQLFSNGSCFQTYAALHGYAAFDYEDLKAYAGAAAPRPSDIVSLLENDPSPFFPLMLYARAPRPAHNGVPIRRVLKTVRVPELTPGGLAAEEKDGVMRLTFGVWSEWPHYARAYYERAAQRLVLGACTEPGYAKAAAFLTGVLPADTSPGTDVSMTMHLAIREILGMRDPGEEYEEIFSEDEPPSPELERLNRAIGEMNRMLYRGETPDYEDIARRHGVSVRALMYVEKMVRELPAAKRPVFGEGLPGFTQPPPVVVESFRRGFADGDFAEFPPVPADCLPEHPPAGGFAGLARYVQESYEGLFETFNPVILTYTVFLLARRGGEWEDASRYAYEVLNLWGRSVLSGRGKREVGAFVNRYTERFMKGLLAESGLVQVDGERVRATPFFSRWIKLRESGPGVS